MIQFDLSEYENHETFYDSHFFNDPKENAWIRRQNELNAQFKENVIRYVGLHDHPKRELIWEYVHNQFVEQDIGAAMNSYECLEWKLEQMIKISRLFK